MVRFLHKTGAGVMIGGFLVALAGGMRVHQGPDGTWFQVNLVHGVGSGMLLFGMAMVVIAALASTPSSTAPETAPANGRK